MSLFVLDTDILTLLEAGKANVNSHVNSHRPSEVAVTVITVEEQLSGWYTLIRQSTRTDKLALAYHRLAKTIRSLSGLTFVEYDILSINRYESLRKLKLNVRKMDLRIAAIVLEIGATLVTRNARDFQQIPGLTFVDWSQ